MKILLLIIPIIFIYSHLNAQQIPTVGQNGETDDIGITVIAAGTQFKSIATATQWENGRIWLARTYSHFCELYTSDNQGLSFTLKKQFDWFEQVSDDDLDIQLVKDFNTDTWWVFVTGSIVYSDQSKGVLFSRVREDGNLSWTGILARPGTTGYSQYWSRITSDYMTNYFAQKDTANVYITATLDNQVNSSVKRSYQRMFKVENIFAPTPYYAGNCNNITAAYWFYNLNTPNSVNLRNDIYYTGSGGSDFKGVVTSSVYEGGSGNNKIYITRNEGNVENPSDIISDSIDLSDRVTAHKMSGYLNECYLSYLSGSNQNPKFLYSVNNGFETFQTFNIANTNASSLDVYVPDGQDGFRANFLWLTNNGQLYYRSGKPQVSGFWTASAFRMDGAGFAPGSLARVGNVNGSCFAIYSNQNNTTLYSVNGCSGNHVGVEPNEIPVQYSLSQNYPNPFNPNTSIKFEIPKSGFVKLAVYDILGKEVVTLVNEKRDAGVYLVDFNATGLSSGVYFYKLITEDFTDLKKMTLLK